VVQRALGKVPAESPKPTKVPLDLIPLAALVEMANGLAEGAEKYAPWDYRRTGIKASVYVGAALRHLVAFGNGETLDPDSPTGKTHLAGALSSLAILADAFALGYAEDDRPHE